MIQPIKNLKIGLVAVEVLLILIAVLTFTAIAPADIILILVSWIVVPAGLLQFLIIDRLWKYHELCKECEIVKEMVKSEDVR